MTKIEQKNMSERIKERRKRLNFTQEQFAEIIGISASSYTRIENAFQKPALDTLIKISRNLQISLDYLVFGADSEKPMDTTSNDLMEAVLHYSDKEKLLHASKVLEKIANLKED